MMRPLITCAVSIAATLFCVAKSMACMTSHSSVLFSPPVVATLTFRYFAGTAVPRSRRTPPLYWNNCRCASFRWNGNSASDTAPYFTTAPVGNAPAGTSIATPPGPSRRPPSGPTASETVPSLLFCLNRASETTVLLPAASVMISWSLSVTAAATSAVKPPLGSRTTGVNAPVVRFLIRAVSCEPAVPCVALILVFPSVPGIVAVMLPAGGGGGAIVSRLVNLVSNGAGSVRPNGSATPWLTVSVYAVLGASGSRERNVATVLLPVSASVPTTAPALDVRRTVWSVAVAASTGLEKRTTIGSASAMLTAPSTGVTDMTVGGRAASARSRGTTCRGADAVTGALTVSVFCRSSAVTVTLPNATTEM